MNLALHGLLLQVIVSIVQFHHGFRLCSAGEPGYLDFDNLPETNFSCQGKVIGGYYADVEAGCQMFHVCTIGQKDEIMDIKFLCLNGTVFDQETRVCERVDEVDCSKSERFYNLNLELYGNNAVTLSLHDTGVEDEDDSSDLLEDHESQRTTSSRPSTTTSTTTTTSRPSISSTTSSSGSYQHPNGGYSQHFQPQPRFPSVQTSQSKSLYDDKNGGYHHQYIYHNGDHRNNNVDTNNDGNNNNNHNHNQNHNNNNNQATSYQLFSNQGVSSTTGPPQIHQIRYSSTPSTQIQIHNDHQPTVSPIFHATSSTIQTLLNSNANSPALINPIFHNHGISSTTEQFTVHNNNPRETPEYRDDSEGDDGAEEDRRPLEAIQPTTQGKVSKLTISPPHEGNDRQQGKNGQSPQQQRITTSFLPTPASDANHAVRSFYPTPRTSTKSSSSHVTHIHLPPPPAIPQLKPHQVTINLPPPDIQRIVQNPSPLLPSQSRVIVTAKASVSDESGRPLNSTQLVTLPLPTIPASYDDYKEGDESFDPFYRDVPKVRNGRRIAGHFRWTETRGKRSVRTRRDVEATVEETEDITRFEIANKNPEEKTATKVQDKDMEMGKHIMTMTSKHRINTEDEDEEKTAIYTKEADVEEYVELDRKSKTDIDSRETDAEEYVNTEEEMIDSKIFEEPESQTSKEVEIRAVDQQDSIYSKDRSNRLNKEDKNLISEKSNSLGSSKRHPEEKSARFSLALPKDVDSKSSQKHSSTKLNLNDDISESKEKVEEELDEEMEEEVSRENSRDDYYYYDADFDDSNLKTNEGDSVEYSKESPNKISSKHEPTRRSKSSKKILNDEDYYDLPEDSTTQSNEQIFSDEMSSEYEDSRQNSSPEDSRELQDDEGEPLKNRDNTPQELVDETTTSTEQMDSSEKSTINNDNKSPSEEDYFSEGVLKFTDEIPRSEKAEESEEVEKLETVDETLQDYIDDNYEPQSYKEHKISSTTEAITSLNIAEDENTRFADDKDDYFTTALSLPEVVEDVDHRQNDEAQLENKTKVIESPSKKSLDEPIESEGTSTTASTMSITTILETTTMEILTTTSPTTLATTTISSATTATTSATTPETTSTTTPATPATTSTTTPATTSTPLTTTPATPATTTTPSTTTPAITTTPSTTTPAITTTPSTTPATTTTTTRSTTSRPTPPRLLKPFTIRKNYVYIPPTTTPVPVVIKPRLPLLNPKPAKPIKSYNDLAPKPIIRKSPLFARKALITRTTTPYGIKNLEDSTEVPAATPETPKMKEITLSLITTEFPTTQATKSSSPIATTLPSIKPDENPKIKDNNVPMSIPDNVPVSSAIESQTFTPYPILKMTESTFVEKKNILEEKKDLEAISTSEKSYVESNDVPNVSESGNSSSTSDTVTLAIPEQYSTTKSPSSSSAEPQKSESVFVEPTSDSLTLQSNGATSKPEIDISLPTTSGSGLDEVTTEISAVNNRTPTLKLIKAVNRRPGTIKRTASFNCLEKEMYRFYADGRDCRLFHYCSPGFTSRQVLDFRFVCEEGTAFDEETQSCIHDVKSPKCRKRVW